jgi:hypothetical protein
MILLIVVSTTSISMTCSGELHVHHWLIRKILLFTIAVLWRLVVR